MSWNSFPHVLFLSNKTQIGMSMQFLQCSINVDHWSKCSLGRQQHKFQVLDERPLFYYASENRLYIVHYFFVVNKRPLISLFQVLPCTTIFSLLLLGEIEQRIQ